MQGKTVVITGATSGIGEVAALELAGMGARIVFTARSKERGEATLARLTQKAPGAAHKVHYGDLAQIAEMKRIAADIAAAEPRIDNAGAMFAERQLTQDGLELTFATNHLSYFVLTAGLRERLLASVPARIINTSSDAHRYGSFDLDDLQSAKKTYNGMQTYGGSKLANILFTRELARRLKGTGLAANSLHPGVVATRFGNESGGLVQSVMRIVKFVAISPEKGAQTIVYLASSPAVETVSGEYFYKSRVATPIRAAQDDRLARALWQKSVELTGVDWA